MQNFLYIFSIILTSLTIATSQDGEITGKLMEDESITVPFANVILKNPADSNIVKIEVSDENGVFKFVKLPRQNYLLEVSYVGFNPIAKTVDLTQSPTVDLGVLTFETGSIELVETVITARRAMVEVKPDRTVFNVQGTINSVGSDAMTLLRKAPGVLVDNNDNITVLGRSGVLLYVDGKRVPLTGDELTNYLQSLTAEQIDRIDIISNPGAKYEAEGNAGIIDIRLKRDKNIGTNGSINSSFSQGKRSRFNTNLRLNHRNKFMNTFGSIGFRDNNGLNNIEFINFQNGLRMMEDNNMEWSGNGLDYRLGTDFFINKNSTLGFLFSGQNGDNINTNDSRITIAQQNSNTIDSILVANNVRDRDRDQKTYNINYAFKNSQNQNLNIDLDYGRYSTIADLDQPNYYYDATESTVISSVLNANTTDTEIDIYSAKLDYEMDLWGGRIGTGAKFTRVESDNTFEFFDVVNENRLINNAQSNRFVYTENVTAGYVSYNRALNEKWSMTSGLRVENTDATGMLTAYDPAQQEDPVVQEYVSWFPNAGLTFQAAPKHTFSMNYGRRINRPDYNILNPFEMQLSQLTYEKGNERLRPEIVNNVELGYTLAYRYNFKLAYSKTTDQITRLLEPESGSEQDSRASFITWDNLASQTVWSFNASAPIQFTEKWNGFFNFSASHLDNQADYGERGTVDLQAFTYTIYQQQTFSLPKGFTAELSGYFSGPGVWGGVFEYEENWSLNFGIQKKFLNDNLNVRIGVDDIFFQTGWEGVSDFNGLVGVGMGNWDSRRGSISVTYNFGNQNVKSRKRKTGIEKEASRVSNGN